MRRFGQLIAVLCFWGLLTEAQEPPPDAPMPPNLQEFDLREIKRNRNRDHKEIVRVHGNVTVKKGESVGEIVVVAGKLQMEGEVNGDIVAVASEAFIDGIVHGSVVVVPGPVRFGPNADIRDDAVVVGEYTRDDNAKFGNFKEVPVPNIVPLVNGVKDYIFEGVVLLRPLPPSLRWVWMVHLAFFITLLGLTLLFPKPVQITADAIANRPVVSIFSGFLTVILFVPALVLLIATVVGLIAVPFAFVGLVLAGLFGKAAVLEFIGQQIGRNLRVAILESPLVAVIIGGLVLSALYMVPILGMMVWGIATLLGLGAVMVAMASALNSQSIPTPAGPPNPAGIPPVAPAMPAGDPIAPEAVVPSGAGAPVYVRRVGFWKRFFASLLDWMLLAIPAVVLSATLAPAIPLLLIGYFVAMWTWKGTTIGGICLGLKVVRTDGTPIDFAVALVRSLASCFSAAVLFMGFFWAGWDREKQSWHDKIAGTIVVQIPKGVSLL